MKPSSLMSILKLCEVTCVVYLLLITHAWCQPQPSNLARSKTVSKGGTNRWGNNRNTVDGNTGATINSGGTGCSGCFVTIENTPAWWKVNLGEPYYVSSIMIYSPLSGAWAVRMASETTKILLSNGPQDIQADNTDSYSNYQVLPYAPQLEPVTNIQYNQPVTTVRYAQYVAIATGYSSAVTTGIMLAEVEVLGFTVAEFIPRVFSAQGISASSIKLTWKSPTDQQIGNIQYEFRCGGSNAWIDFSTSHIDNIERVVRDLASDTQYTCQVRVKHSTAAAKSSTATTHCDTPPSPQNLQFGAPTQVNHESRIRWRYTISWESVSCPHPTNPYKLSVDGQVIESHQGESYTYYADGYTAASVSVWARNRQGVLSANPRVKSITTAQGLPPQGQPRNFNLNAVSHHCLSYSANSPMYPNSPENQIYYQIRCGNEYTWQNPNPMCGLSPFTSYTCLIRARNNAVGASGSVSDSATTFCSGPSLPRDVSVTYLGISSNGGRNRARYRVSWTAPATSNCDSLRSSNKYEAYHEGSWRWSYNNYLYYDGIYAEGNVQLEVKVRAYNNRNNVSDQATVTTTTQSIPPQIRPNSYTLVSNSPYCVTMSWTPPTYENGPITVYQYKCTNDANWRDAGGGRNDRSETRCGYSPYTLVTCLIRARNSAGPSEDDTKTVRTQCAAPTQPQNIEFTDEGTHQDSGRLRRRYRVSWQAPAQHNCLKLRDTNRYSFRDPDNGGQRYNTNNNYYDIYTEGDVDITVRVTATNNRNNVSASQSATYRTAPFRPQKTPTNFALISYSPQCIRMTWNSPDHPNGVIVSYQYMCTEDVNWVTIPGGGGVRTADRCGYARPYTQVTCELKAGNVQDYSDAASQGPTRTNCDNPVLPRNISAYIVDEKYFEVSANRSRRRIKFHLLKNVIDANCAEIPNDGMKFGLIGLGVVDNGGYINNLDAAKSYVIYVTVTNNGNNQTNTTFSHSTGELAPYTQPQLALRFNTTCAILTLSEPSEPNGVITHYKYGCDYYTKDGIPAADKNVTTEDLRTGAVPTVCEFESASRLTCQLVAVNSEGESPPALGYGNTNLKATGDQLDGESDLYRYQKSPGVFADCDCTSLSENPQCDSDGQCPCKIINGEDVTLAGRQCNWYISDIDPLFGPVAGGTPVTMKGGYFSQGDLSATLWNDQLDINNNETTASFVTPAAEIPDNITVTVDLVLELYSNNGSVGPQKIYYPYEYRPNPIMEDIQPRSSFLSGGYNLTVTGKFMDSVAYPEMIIYVTQHGIDVENYTTECVVFDASSMLCPTPDVRDVTKEILRRGQTQPTEDPSGEALNGLKGIEYTFGFRYDGYENNTDLRTHPTLKDIAELIVFEDPVIKTLEESTGNEILEYDPKSDNFIRIEGEGLYWDADQWVVQIGKGECQVISVFSNQVTCKPPSEIPEIDKAVDYMTHRGVDIPHIVVRIGNIRPTAVGYVYYKTNLWKDNVGFRAAMIVLIILVIIAILAALFYVLWRKRIINIWQPEITNNKDAYNDNDLSARYVPSPGGGEVDSVAPFLGKKLDKDLQIKVNRCNIPKERLQMEQKLGKGNFGLVYKACLTLPNGNLKTVAVKTIKEDKEMSFEDLENFLAEGTLMIDFKHENVLSLVGVVCEQGDRPLIVLPYMENGDLCTFIRRDDVDLLLADLLHFAYQMANGMEYLAKERFVHRDLAARNCMVDGSYIVKIADFGMSRDVYEKDYYTMDNMNKPLPMKWMAVESLKEGRYTSKSDVWSYGITMWELLTRGSSPYPGVNNYYIKEYVVTGKRLDRPDICPPIIYEMMVRCWEENPDNRPTFSEISRFIKMLLDGQTKPQAGSTEEDAYSYTRKATKDIPEDYMSPSADSHHYDDYITPLPVDNDYIQPQPSVKAPAPPPVAVSADTTSIEMAPVPAKRTYIPAQDRDYINQSVNMMA